jgi:CheY-like chemotaxis protein
MATPLLGSFSASRLGITRSPDVRGRMSETHPPATISGHRLRAAALSTVPLANSPMDRRDLPVVPRTATPDKPTLPFSGTETILVVDDEAAYRRLIPKMLKPYGYTVLSAVGAEEALAVEAQYTGTIHLLVSDIVMPGLSGPGLAQRIVPRRPSIRVLFISGFASQVMIDQLSRSPHTSFLAKPFKAEALAKAVRQRIDRVTPPQTRTGDPWSSR